MTDHTTFFISCSICYICCCQSITIFEVCVLTVDADGYGKGGGVYAEADGCNSTVSMLGCIVIDNFAGRGTNFLLVE